MDWYSACPMPVAVVPTMVTVVTPAHRREHTCMHGRMAAMNERSGQRRVHALMQMRVRVHGRHGPAY